MITIPEVARRRRFRLPPKEMGLYDHLIIARTSKREIAFIADLVAGVLEYRDAEVTAADRIVPGETLWGIVWGMDFKAKRKGPPKAGRGRTLDHQPTMAGVRGAPADEGTRPGPEPVREIP